MFSPAFPSCSYALVHPVPGRSQLQLSQEGLQILREVTGPVAPIVVIGPYRSGKSFLLNQLLGVKCGKCSTCSKTVHRNKAAAMSHQNGFPQIPDSVWAIPGRQRLRASGSGAKLRSGMRELTSSSR
jgi:hypothetical protein